MLLLAVWWVFLIHFHLSFFFNSFFWLRKFVSFFNHKTVLVAVFVALALFWLFFRSVKAYLQELMRRYAKNYLPILFNQYTCDEDNVAVATHDVKGVHGATLETVRLYVELTPEDLVTRYANSAIEKAQSSENSIAKKVGFVLLKLQLLLAACTVH